MSDVFAALADPNRRTIAARLAADGPLSATALARELPITRQAVGKHLSVLGAAGLVASVRVGRETLYTFDHAPLSDVGDWIRVTGASWDARLERLRSRSAREDHAD